MMSLCVLSLFSTVVLLSPPQIIADILTLMPLPFPARVYILLVAVTNVVISLVFEQWGAQAVAVVVGKVLRWRKPRRRVKEGKAYRAVEGNDPGAV